MVKLRKKCGEYCLKSPQELLKTAKRCVNTLKNGA